MRYTRMFTLLMVAVVAAAVNANAWAGKPTIERVTVDEVGIDPFLSELCGFDVMASAQGHVIFRTFEDDGRGLLELTTLNVRVELSANGKTVDIHDVGADQLRVMPDGTVILSIIGQIPFFDAFNGVLKINVETGEVIHEPQRLTGGEQAVCEALSP